MRPLSDSLAGHMRRALTCLCLVVVLADTASAGFTTGMRAYQEGDYTTAAEHLRPMAEQGMLEAQYLLGTLYARGQGVPQDFVQAMDWFRKAAEQGDRRAQYNLGVMYDRGDGVSPDPAQAAIWYRKAAEQGLAQAQNNLGVMYAEGQGVDRDDVQAYMWLSLAAEQGVQSALQNRAATAETMTPDQISEAEDLLKSWRRARPPGR